MPARLENASPNSGRSVGDHCELHITSEKFDEPSANPIVFGAETVLGVHGRADDGDGATTWVGGLDASRRDKIVAELVQAGFSAEVRRLGQSLAGTARDNICNRGKSKMGVQLEIPRTLRNQLAGDAEQLSNFAKAVADAMQANPPSNGDKRGEQSRVDN